MRTGDGLLARLVPEAPILLDDFAALCQASQAYGNGIMEVTQRGSLQVRGLTERGASDFAHETTLLGLGSDRGPAVLTSPLMGLEPQAHDLRDSVTRLHAEVAACPALLALGPKVSVLVDGGGALHLDGIPADLRVRAETATQVHLSIAGTAITASPLGSVPSHEIERVIVAILACIAKRGEGARARDFLTTEGVATLRAAIPVAVREVPPSKSRPAVDCVGVHQLANGRVALGIALAFGYAQAGQLDRLTKAVIRVGATSVRPAPGRTLLILDLPSPAAPEIAILAAQEGFITQPTDARRHVVACAGAPACASALLDTRQLAPQIARAAASLLDGSFTVHLSGCAKGCAHSEAAALTLVGPNHLIVDGRAGDRAHATISTAALMSGLVRLGEQHQQSLPPRERSKQLLSRLGSTQLIELFGRMPA
jgi:precorrin-3B synthase